MATGLAEQVEEKRDEDKTNFFRLFLCPDQSLFQARHEERQCRNNLARRKKTDPFIKSFGSYFTTSFHRVQKTMDNRTFDLTKY